MTTDTEAPSPDSVADSDDPGDDTARRYWYQWAYAAVVCCLILDNTKSVEEVFCEHHEDILVKYKNGKFSGKQVKTRRSDQALWNTSDKQLKTAFSKFVKLEKEFPGLFNSFHFLTNHPFQASKNGQDVCFILAEIKKVKSADELSRTAAKFVSVIAKEANCTVEVTFSALVKSRASDELPKLSDITARLVHSLTSVWPPASNCSHASVTRAASALIVLCGEASSLAHHSILPAYLTVSDNHDAEELAARLNGKRIDVEKLLRVLDQGLKEMATLGGDPDFYVEPGTGTKDLLSKKLNAGGFSVISLNSATDLRDKADYLAIGWIKKHGRKAGLERYNHLRSLVLTDAASAFESTKTEDRVFGVHMLDLLRKKFDTRLSNDTQIYDCSREHLEGFTYSLTSECKVQWSIDRPWETE